MFTYVDPWQLGFAPADPSDPSVDKKVLKMDGMFTCLLSAFQIALFIQFDL